MGLVTYSELAQKLGKTRAYISKLKKKGIFDDCIEGKKIDYDCAIEAIKNNTKDFKKVDIKKLENKKIIQKNLPENLPVTDEMIGELEELLIDVSNPSQKVAIIKDYWLGKINQLKYEAEREKYFLKEEVKEEVQKIASVVRQRLFNIPEKIAPLCYGKEISEIKELIYNSINEALEDLQKMERWK